MSRSSAGSEADLDAGTAIVAALRAIGERLDTLEPASLADEPDAVHQLRTHVRRLRSVLAVYASVFDPSVAAALRRTYGAFGKELGTVRDIEVRVQVAERALTEASGANRGSEASDAAASVSDTASASAPAEVAAARARLIADELEAHRLAHARFAERQRMPRAVARRAALAAFLAAPPFTSLASGPAVDVLGDLLQREARRAGERADRIDSSTGAEELHRVRKAGRRLRYASEAVTEEPVTLFGDGARALAHVGERLHDVLGDHRDEVLFAEHVRRAAAHAAHAGEPVGLLARLAEAAERRAAGRLDELPAVIEDLRDAGQEWAFR
ncbi:CHAD domain-containing protein [Agromyces sp. NPDC058484]|uniref:CHAD domain-containing protein n=1 Tax=Agromyces sp. NPDC058484 TaxID=3346524 RepID=UPI003649D8CF